jgi:AcrR family transcriptional regulator
MARGRGTGKAAIDPRVILEAAFRLYADEGESGFSVRKVGALVGVDPMTVLHHFKSKNDLLRRIADRALSEITMPPPSGSWKTDLLTVAEAYRALAGRYPRVFHLHFRFHVTGPVDHVSSERVYQAMLDAGLPAQSAAGQGLAFYSFVMGFALAEAEGLLRPITDADEQELLALDPGLFPASRSLVPAFKSLDPSSAFHLAVEAYISGIEATSR